MPAKAKAFRVLLKSERTRVGLTQKKAAIMLTVPLRTYCDWEYGITIPAQVTQEGALARLKNK